MQNLLSAILGYAVAVVTLLGGLFAILDRLGVFRKRQLVRLYRQAVTRLARKNQITPDTRRALTKALRNSELGGVFLSDNYEPQPERTKLQEITKGAVSDTAIDQLLREEHIIEGEQDPKSWLHERFRNRHGYFARISGSDEDFPAQGPVTPKVPTGAPGALLSEPSLFFTPTSMLDSGRYFVGRYEDRQQLENYFASSTADGLFVIEGLAGMGKTALATKVLRDIALDNYTVLWVDCGTDVTMQRFLDEISRMAESLGYPHLTHSLASLREGKGEGADEIRDSIRARALVSFLQWAGAESHTTGMKPIAIVFDDFQNVTDTALHRLISKITRGTLPAKIIVVTANQGPILKSLHMEGGKFGLCQLRSLTRGECEELINLVAREEHIAGLLDLSQDDLTEIIKKTGGMPFRIRVFINMARDFTLRQLLTLPDYEEDGNALFRALYASFDEAEQRVSDAASILRLPITYDGLRDISEVAEPDFFRVVRSLVDHFVLEFNGDTYSMPKSLADYVREHARTTTPERAHQLHKAAANRYRSLAAVEPKRAADYRLESSYHFIHAGDRIAAAEVISPAIGALLAWGRYQEVSDILDAFTAADPGKPLTSILPSPQLLLGFSDVLHARNRESRKAIEILDNLIATTEGETRILAMQRLAFVEREVGNHPRAKVLYSESKDLAEQAGLPKLQVEALYGLQHIAYFDGEYDKVLEYNQERLRILHTLDLDNPDEHDYVSDNEAWTKANSANIYRERGDFSTAMRLYNEALAAWATLGNPPWRVGWTYYDIAQIYHQQGDFSQAQRDYDRAYHVFQDAAYSVGIAHVEIEYGRNGSKLISADGMKQHTLTECLKHVDHAISMLFDIKSALAFAYTAKGEIYLNFGEIKEALRFLDDGLKRETDLRNDRKIGRCYHLMGLATEAQALLLLKAGETSTARNRLGEALKYVQTAGSHYERVKVDPDLGGLKTDTERLQMEYRDCPER